jgi:hypothetical protein
MGISSYVWSIVWFVLVPEMAGSVWQRRDEKLTFSSILENWIYGTVTMMAAAQLLLVPMIARHAHFSTFVVVWLGCMGIICACGMVRIVHAAGGQRNLPTVHPKQVCMYLIVLGVILGQCAAASWLKHSDADDARFISEAVIAVEQNRMYLDSPITGEEMGELVGEVRKDLTSPWTMYLALLSKLCNAGPAALAHTIVPFYFVFFFYAVMGLAGFLVFGKQREKICCFLFILSVYNMFDYISTHTVSTVLLLRIWQGKAFVAAGILPLLFYCFLKMQEGDNPRKAYWGIGLTAFAAALASGIGNVVSPVMIAVYGLVEGVKNRNMIRMLKVWALMIPNMVYLLCQYKYFQLFIAPWY